MFGGIGVQEVLVILIVGLLVFGATRLPKIARSLGLGIKEFKKTIKSVEDDEEEEKSQIRYVQNQPPVYQQYQNPYNPGMQQQAQGPGYGQGAPYQQNPQYQQNQGPGYGQPGGQPNVQQPPQQPQQPQQNQGPGYGQPGGQPNVQQPPQQPQQPQQDQPKPQGDGTQQG